MELLPLTGPKSRRKIEKTRHVKNSDKSKNLF